MMCVEKFIYDTLKRKSFARGTFFQAFSFDTSQESRNPACTREYRVPLYNKVEGAFVNVVVGSTEWTDDELIL